jgi:2-amino-4-hydroxy-6-hydroxymethyldihydropteridine diphosphokinase
LPGYEYFSKILISVFSVPSVVRNILTYIGIGSNLGDSLENCRAAIRVMAADTRNQIVKISPFYRTEPVGKKDQDWFINAVVAVKTSLSPRELLRFLQNIEREMGRVRKERWGPRIIDLDILFYENQVIQNEELRVPHPGIHERRFVLAPLNDIAPDLRHPLLEKTISQLLAALPQAEKVILLPDTDS